MSLSRSDEDVQNLMELDETMNSYFGMEMFGIKIELKKLVSKDDTRALEILKRTTVNDQHPC